MREIFDRIFGRFAQAVEIHSKFEWTLKLFLWVALLWPQRGWVWTHRESLEALLRLAGGEKAVAWLVPALWTLSVALFFFMAVKGLDLLLPRKVVASVAAPVATEGSKAKLSNTLGPTLSPFNFSPKKIRFRKDEDPYVQIGDMLYTEKDLFTSVLITGVTGTGKTSAAVFPMLEQIFSIYNEPDSGPLGNVGGLCLDVKGEFFEGIIYYMHKAGRNVFEDIQVIRPNCLMPVARFKDPDTGYLFFLNAKACSSGAEAWDLVRGKKFKDGTEIPLNVFTLPKRRLAALEEKLKELVFDVRDKPLNYLGWRHHNGQLLRITHTPEFNRTQIATDARGARIGITPPKKLVFDGISYIDNALRYNIVEPNKPAPEAAMRLNLISTLAEGEKQTGENAYWYKRARSHIGSCIELWRLAYDETPQCTAQAIYKITQQDDFCRKQVKVVEKKIKELNDALEKVTDFSERVSLEREAERMTSIVKYFSEEWGKYDSKTKTIVGSVVANAFDTFNKDPVLQDSFCQPKTFSFEQCINEGKIFVLVAGDEYETVAKILGTALKMDFQSVVLSRVHRSELNQKRKVMLVNDECQKFVVAGGSQGAGDEHFMSLCRQSRCFNVNATQADSWIISVVGKENSDVYLQNYNGRIWFRTNDKETAEKAEQLCGIKKQKTRSSGSEKVIHLENLILGPKGSADHTPSFSEKEDEKPRFAKDKFYNLEMWECILFNGTRTGSEKACQSQCSPAYVGSEEGRKEVSEVMKLYFQGYLENLAYRQNGGKLFDPTPQAAAKQEEKKDAQPAPAAPGEGAPGKMQAPQTPASSDAPAVKPSITQSPIPIASAENTAPRTVAVPPVASSAPSVDAAPPPQLSSFGNPEEIKTRAKKLLRSVQVVEPRLSKPEAATAAPFAKKEGEASPVPSVPTPQQLPRVDASFDPDEVTPKELTAAATNYKENPAEGVQQALKEANFIPPTNPADYLPVQQEAELGNTSGNRELAAERAALGPKGQQGGNPAFALAQGGSIRVPGSPADAFERMQEKSLQEEQAVLTKGFVEAISAKEGPKPDEETLALLKNLKPETEGNK